MLENYVVEKVASLIRLTYILSLDALAAAGKAELVVVHRGALHEVGVLQSLLAQGALERGILGSSRRRRSCRIRSGTAAGSSSKTAAARRFVLLLLTPTKMWFCCCCCCCCCLVGRHGQIQSIIFMSAAVEMPPPWPKKSVAP